MNILKSKLPSVGTTIFTIMSQLAKEHNAINLSQGFPNFPVDPVLVNILKRKSSQDVHQYAPMTGSPELMTQVSKLIYDNYQRNIEPSSELLITAGATQAIFTTILALISPGDEVIILDPSYDCYEPAVILAGGTPIHVQLGNDFLPDWNKIEDAFSSKTKMLITNNPHNPSGRMWSEKDMSELESILLKNEKVILLSDEVYEFIHFENKHISAHSLPSLFDRTIITSSFGKTFHITGWKMGYLVAPENVMIEIKKVHQFNIFSVNSVAQSVLAEYLNVAKVDELGVFYQQKRDLFRSLMQPSSFELLPCEGTYFQTVNYKAISQQNDVEFCKELAIKHKVAAIPISVFNKSNLDQKIIRFCFAKNDETLISATKILCQI
ncbi:MAG TPA: aminotransferase class I/II-fold pyridoxal phosphate-dependent enzyme [Crocinitomicaceae bacterium]|nr:aminotransferase class I/II-fold pyridoxal phosphate-dependent enzyme [Crocinitomicaceae bacterium]